MKSYISTMTEDELVAHHVKMVNDCADLARKVVEDDLDFGLVFDEVAAIHKELKVIEEEFEIRDAMTQAVGESSH